MNNLITIVIPVYNREHLVQRTLRSIEQQNHRPLSVILVDNNSTDNTLAALDSWARRVTADDFEVRVISEPTPGAPAARNAGLRLVATPYTMFFDSDDEMLPDHVAQFEHAIGRHPEVDIIGRTIVYRHADGSVQRLPFTTRRPWYNHIFHATLSTQRFVGRTDLFRRAGGWDGSVMRWNDYELGIRLLLQNPVMMTLPGEPTVVINQSEVSITGSRFYDPALRCEHALDRCYIDVAPLGNRRLLDWINTRRVILAAKYRLEGEKAQARRLLDRTLKGAHGARRLHLLYLMHLLCPRGTAIPAAVFF